MRMVDCVPLLEEVHAEGMQLDPGHDHEHCEEDHHHEEPEDGDGHEDHAETHEKDHGLGAVTGMDEHVWTSPENAILIVTALTEEIALIDPDNAATYRANAAAYIAKLIALDNRFESLIQSQTKPIVFGDRFPLLYFAEHYALRYETAFASCHVTSEPSPARVNELIALCRAEKITHVFHIEGGSHSVADRIAADIGGDTILFHSCHKVTAEEMAAGATYLSLMEANYLALQKALS
jgi:zinc transport system substrate-binding protein